MWVRRSERSCRAHRSGPRHEIPDYGRTIQAIWRWRTNRIAGSSSMHWGLRTRCPYRCDVARTPSKGRLRACWHTRVVGKWEGGELAARRTSCARVLGQVPPQRLGPTTFPTEQAGWWHHAAHAIRQKTRWSAVCTWYWTRGHCSVRPTGSSSSG